MKLPSPPRTSSLPYVLMLIALGVLPSTGCLHLLLASGLYMWQGGNVVPAKCNELEGQRVVVFCPPPPSSEFRHAGASRQLAQRLSSKLAKDVPKIDVVDPKEVDNWVDENGPDKYKELGKAVKANRLVRVEMDHFDLYNGPTLYQGAAEITVYVYDIDNGGKLLWDERLGEFKFPTHSGTPVQDKSVSQFQNQFIEILASELGRYFYKHDPHANFALDATAND
ncbi:hypothetical protein Pla175_03850 [Pirellulimonas nuda]|uniref:Uncharacterized protein n=1 Tax=Pirellulimonas nuda TaxID=2528009 RepID=A0A518D6F7_9BACT|nr:hypothetical protein [Pirellulimonas nuda]QDU87031.1 hypothetical protein Pla175_03850 [Pirellulimonas nuda]